MGRVGLDGSVDGEYTEGEYRRGDAETWRRVNEAVVARMDARGDDGLGEKSARNLNTPTQVRPQRHGR